MPIKIKNGSKNISKKIENNNHYLKKNDYY